MTTQPTLSLRSFRVLLVTIALALASTLGSVSADVLTPLEDTGGPGGGSGYGGQIDETVRAQNLDALTGGGAVAAGPESPHSNAY